MGEKTILWLGKISLTADFADLRGLLKPGGSMALFTKPLIPAAHAGRAFGLAWVAACMSVGRRLC